MAKKPTRAELARHVRKTLELLELQRDRAIAEAVETRDELKRKMITNAELEDRLIRVKTDRDALMAELVGVSASRSTANSAAHTLTQENTRLRAALALAESERAILLQTVRAMVEHATEWTP